MKKETAVNQTFRILSAIAMILVVMGHVDEGMLTIGGLFPYYSFHIALFLFISGYFYNPREEEQIGAYLKHKARRLLFVYFVWNVFYGFLAVLLRKAGFFIGNEPNLRTLFVEPFLSGHQFLYNAPAWFVPALFLTEAANVLIRAVLRFFAKLLSGRKKDSLGQWMNRYTDWILMGLYLCLGFAAAWLSAHGYVYDWYRIPGRMMYMLPCFQMGQLYRRKLEEKDRMSNGLYFGILLTVQLLLSVCCRGLAVSAAWCNGFLNGPVIPYVTAATGIAFWLRIAKILTPALGESRFWLFFGKNTYTVMMHQLPAMLLVKAVFALGNMAGYFPDFDWEAYLTDVYYCYLPGGLPQFKLLYVAAGIGLPLLMRAVWERWFRKGKEIPAVHQTTV